MALLLHGSRVPGWPEPPLPSSDYDILAIGEVGSREHRRVRSSRADLVVISKRGFRGGQLLSPETHVLLKFGTRVGDWAWLDSTIDLSWAGADDALEDANALLDAARMNWPDNPTSVCRLAMEAIRRCLALRLAIGVVDEAPTWAIATRLYAADADMVSHVRMRTLEGCQPANVHAWACNALAGAQQAIADVEPAVASYPRNASDDQLAVLVR